MVVAAVEAMEQAEHFRGFRIGQAVEHGLRLAAGGHHPAVAQQGEVLAIESGLQAGLQPGERVVSDGGDRLRPGARVELPLAGEAGSGSAPGPGPGPRASAAARAVGAGRRVLLAMRKKISKINNLSTFLEGGSVTFSSSAAA